MIHRGVVTAMSNAASGKHDPLYRDEPIMEFAWDLCERVGAFLMVYPDLDVPIGANRLRRALYLAAGLDVDYAYELVCRGLLYLQGGTAMAPEFVEPLPCAPLPRGSVGPRRLSMA